MGLLTDPHTERSKLVKFICKFNVLLCTVLYIGAIIWLCLLPYSKISMPIYFSENALLPGLVKTEFTQETLAKDYHEELLYEMKKYKDSIPYPWLLAKFRQIGLDTYSHNFTLNYPLGKRQSFTGNNVYGILRAARAASTEAVVLSVPFRPPNNANPTTAPSIAIMLAFAKYANRDKYWAKDIIFLVTEHEQLGMEAWLEAYHGTGLEVKQVLNHGDLRGRAGQIQAAINLELNDLKIAVMDIKVEGLNGQLPNLDLFTLVNKMCLKEGLHVTFKNRGNIHVQNDLYRHWKHSLITMLSMILTQSTGIPNGNHGLFHRYGIQAVTMHGFLRPNSRGNQIGFFSMGKILEGIFRSLNNLLERFHQSYFFYLLPSNDRFLSIIYYMPVLGLLVGALLVRSLLHWYQVCYNPYADNKLDVFESNIVEEPEIDDDTYDIDAVKIFALYFTSHIFGIVLMKSPPLITSYGADYGYPTEKSVFNTLAIISAILVLLPFCLRLNKYKSMLTLNMLIIWELALVLLGMGMINFSLGVLCAILYVPVTLIITPTLNRIRARFQYLMWLLVHPLLVLIFVVMVYTFCMFPNSTISEQIEKGFAAAQQALVFGIVDSYIYGNWIYNVACCVFMPVWLCMSCLIMSSPYVEDEVEVQETEKEKLE